MKNLGYQNQLQQKKEEKKKQDMNMNSLMGNPWEYSQMKLELQLSW